MKTKNTRLVYTDDKNLKIYQSLPDKDFKEFFMTYLTYEIGDDVSKTISNPYLQTMFIAAYADKIKYNEEKWERKAKANRENGKKGGRPPKNNTELQPNTEFDTEAKISPNEPCLAINDTDVPQEAESLPEAKIEAKEEEIIIDTDNTEERFNNIFSERLEKYIYQNRNEIKHNIDVIARYESNSNTIDYMTLEKAKASMSKMISYLGVGTKDSIDLEELYNSEIERATAAIIYQKAMR